MRFFRLVRSCLKVLRPTNVEIKLRVRDVEVPVLGILQPDGFVIVRRPFIDLVDRPDDGRWVTISEAAERLGLTAKGVKYRIKQGYLQAISRISNGQPLSFVRLSDIEALEAVPGGARPTELPGGPWLTPEEFAARIGLTRPAVICRIKHGKLSAIEVPRGPKMHGWLIAASEVESAMRQGHLKNKSRTELADAA